MLEQWLTRFSYTDDGALGRMRHWCVLEEEWQFNKPRVSCIPCGDYVCERSVWRPGTDKALDTFIVTGVPQRDLIKLHPLGTEEDTEGCIGLGLGFQVLPVVKPEEGGGPTHKIGLRHSRIAHAQFMAAMKGVDKFLLHVTDFAGLK